jgi:hypothetical protein
MAICFIWESFEMENAHVRKCRDCRDVRVYISGEIKYVCCSVCGSLNTKRVMGVNGLTVLNGNRPAEKAKSKRPPAYSWRKATEDDIGRLARFADRPGDDWHYGMLTGVERVNIEKLNAEDTFDCTQWENEEPERFFICEVQEVRS